MIRPKAMRHWGKDDKKHPSAVVAPGTCNQRGSVHLDSVSLDNHASLRTMAASPGAGTSNGFPSMLSTWTRWPQTCSVDVDKSRGVSSARIQTQGMGEGYPVADNTTPEGRALNRRVEIKITPVTTDEANAAR